jgi:glutaredoxin
LLRLFGTPGLVFTENPRCPIIHKIILKNDFYLRYMKFTIYSKDGCPYCSKIQQVLELANLQHVVYKLGVDFTHEEFYAEFGQGSTFPQVVLEDKHLGGCTDTVKYLQENSVV